MREFNQTPMCVCSLLLTTPVCPMPCIGSKRRTVQSKRESVTGAYIVMGIGHRRDHVCSATASFFGLASSSWTGPLPSSSSSVSTTRRVGLRSTCVSSICPRSASHIAHDTPGSRARTDLQLELLA